MYSGLFLCKLHKTNAGSSKGERCARKGAVYLLKQTGYPCGILDIWVYEQRELRNVNSGGYASKIALKDRMRGKELPREYGSTRHSSSSLAPMCHDNSLLQMRSLQFSLTQRMSTSEPKLCRVLLSTTQLQTVRVVLGYVMLTRIREPGYIRWFTKQLTHRLFSIQQPADKLTASGFDHQLRKTKQSYLVRCNRSAHQSRPPDI